MRECDMSNMVSVQISLNIGEGLHPVKNTSLKKNVLKIKLVKN